METWRPVVGFEGIYEVSDQGRVKRIGAWSDGRIRKPHVLTPKRKLVPKGSKTYFSVALCKNAARSYHQIHRLILAAFVGPPPSPNAQANHKDGDTLHNVPGNLEWCTSSENRVHSYRLLKTPQGGCQPGSKHHGAKISEDDALAIRALRKRGWTLKKLAAQFGLSVPTVCWIAKGKAWKHI